MRTPSRRVTATTSCALVTLVAAGCASSGGDELVPLAEQTDAAPAEPSPSASSTAADSVEQQHIDEAKALVTAYYDELRDLGNDGYSDVARMQRYWSDRELWSEKVATYDQRRADGWVAEGGAEIVTIEVVEYEPDPTDGGMEQVTLDVCGDVSTLTMLDGDGNPLERDANVPDTYMTRYVVQHQGADASWTIADLVADTSRTC